MEAARHGASSASATKTLAGSIGCCHEQRRKNEVCVQYALRPICAAALRELLGRHKLQRVGSRMSADIDPLLLFPPLSPSECTALLERSGSLLCLDVPPGTQFGVDYSNWTVGARFMGVKLIPPGVHFAWFRCA